MTDIIPILKDLALAGAACVTSYVAITGLGRWQQELNGKANFDTARDLAKSVYGLRDEIKYCRSPFISAHEFPEGYSGASGNNTREEEGQAWTHVYSKRWKPVRKAVRALDVATLEAEALWGKDIKEKVTALKACVRSLNVDIDSFISDKYSGGESFKDRDYAKDVREGIWENKPENNKLTQDINTAIKDIESVIRPHLSRR